MNPARAKSALLADLMRAASVAHDMHVKKYPTRANSKKRREECGEAVCFYIRRAREQARLQ